mmetsp:Transcript_11740/g.21798  ORF Transcript_11740/g.21798 Transcript_11740/m.21798 type:complete len:500 (-) Transcript_11740:116-1615(-)
MFGRFFGNKVTVKKDATIGEIVVNLPDFTGPDVPPALWHLRETKRVILAVPMDIKVVELKKRIHGKTKIPLSSIALFFMGTLLKSDEFVTPEMYEQELTEDSDDDIFRPRLYLGLVEEPEDEVEVEEYSSDSESSEEDSSIGEMQYVNDDDDKVSEIENEAEEDDNSEMPERAFDIKVNLERIGCGRFYEDLMAQGFVDEGSFANLTDEILKNPPLYIPLVSRQRITALADVTKRRLEMSKQTVTQTEAGKLDEEMIILGTLQTKAVEGIEGSFTTKAGLKRAWEKQQKEELKAEQDAIIAAEEAAEQAKLESVANEFKDMFNAEDTKPRKELPEHIRDMIESTKGKLLRDEFECLLDPNTITTSTFCCLSHHDECLKARDGLEEMTKMLIEADLQVAADRVDYHNTTFVCRYQLRLIIQQFLKKYRMPIVDSRVEELLDGCVMTHEDQVRLREWASPEKRSNPLFDIPLSGYSTTRFAAIVADEISRHQQKIVLDKDE